MNALLWAIAALGAEIDADHLLALYEAVRVPLAQDRIDAARDGARAMTSIPHTEIAIAAARVSSASDLGGMRLAFGELSRVVIIELAADGPPAKTKVFRCPMASGWPFWLQASPGIANPYMGLSMPTCGEGTSLQTAAKAASRGP